MEVPIPRPLYIPLPYFSQYLPKVWCSYYLEDLGKMPSQKLDNFSM